MVIYIVEVESLSWMYRKIKNGDWLYLYNQPDSWGIEDFHCIANSALNMAWTEN